MMHLTACERGSQFSVDRIIGCSTESHFMNHQATEVPRACAHLSSGGAVMWKLKGAQMMLQDDCENGLQLGIKHY